MRWVIIEFILFRKPVKTMLCFNYRRPISFSINLSKPKGVRGMTRKPVLKHLAHANLSRPKKRRGQEILRVFTVCSSAVIIQ